jgi:hypothetical protein
MGRSLVVAAVTALLFTALMRTFFGIDPGAGGETAGGLAGRGVLKVLGWAVFGIMMVMQTLAALGRAGR